MVQSGTAPIVLILRHCIYLYENVRIFPIYYVLIHTIEICNHKEKRRALGKARVKRGTWLPQIAISRVLPFTAEGRYEG